MTLEPAVSGASVCRNLSQGESKMENPKVDKAINNCQVDAETKESLLKHLDEHGAVSLLTSAKFGQYAGCFLEEIERAISAESALIASAAGDSTGNQYAAASPAADAIEHESWFLELLYARPSGHMRRKYPGERPHTSKHSRSLG